MQETSDIELLQQYVHRNSDEAFAALVTRHVNMVYSAALRKTGNPSAAEEVTQVVFIILAKKAGGLREKTIISGWLYQTTRLTAINFLRSEIRRVRREQEAYMQSLANEAEPEAWPQIMPLLEDAMGQLGEKDCIAVF
jgi:RNA polymerase sigma factor (sigma-70 family)